MASWARRRRRRRGGRRRGSRIDRLRQRGRIHRHRAVWARPARRAARSRPPRARPARSSRPGGRPPPAARAGARRCRWRRRRPTSASTRTAAVHFSTDQVRVAEDDLRAVLELDDDALLSALAQPLDPLREARRSGPGDEQRAQRARVGHLALRGRLLHPQRPAAPRAAAGRAGRAVAATGSGTPSTGHQRRRGTLGDLDPQAVREVRLDVDRADHRERR